MIIPEADKNCINCRFLHDQTEDEETCNGRECCNWDGEYTRNYFEPDEDYILDEVACCDNCKHKGIDHICVDCSRYSRDDLWEAE